MTLELDRKLGERVRIGNEVVVTVVEINGSRVRLGVTAPKHVRVLRGEQATEPVGRIPAFGTHKSRLEELGRAEREFSRIVDAVVSLLSAAGSEASKLQQPLAEVAAELQLHNQQPSQKAARRLLESLKYLRQSLQAQIPALTAHRSNAAAITAPFAEAARLYDSSSQQERIKQLYQTERDLGPAVEAALTLLEGASAKFFQIEGRLAERIAHGHPKDPYLAQVDGQKLAELLANLPEGLQPIAADLRTVCLNQGTHLSKIR